MVETSPLTKLQVTRRTLKTRFTKLNTYIELIKTYQPEDITRKIVIDLETRLQTLHNLQIEYNELQNKIDLLIEDREREKEETERENNNDTIFRLISEYTFFIEEHTQPPQSNVSDPSRQSPSNLSDTVGQTRQIVPDIKLPTIPVPRFDGTYDRWTEFSDAYGALIHNNETLSDVHKFYYLKSALTGDASDIIQSVEVTSVNYPIAWKLLCERFQNTSLIVNNYIKALFEIQPVANESASVLRNLTDSILKNMRCLKALKQPTEYWDVLIVYLVVSKLDSNTRREWQTERSKGDNLATFEELTTFLKRKCVVLESLPIESAHEYKPKQTRAFNANNSNARTQSHLSVEGTCTYCKQTNHPLYYCTIFKQLPVLKRIAEVKKLRLCYNCLGNNHRTQNCNSIRCRKCNGFHHTILHLDNFNKSDQTDKQSTPTQLTTTPTDSRPTLDRASYNLNSNLTSTSTQPDSDTLKSKQCTISNHSTLNTYSSEVLLSTAIIDVRTATGNYKPCRVLLDPGSQSNFISYNTCKLLNLPAHKFASTSSGVNESSSNSSHRTNITFKSKHNNYQRNLSCLLVPTVTVPLPQTSFDVTFLNIPKNLQLADPHLNESRPIDILIGAELYLSLLCVGQIPLNDYGLTLQKTKLGWILGGTLNTNSLYHNSLSCVSTLETFVQKFWEFENIPTTKTLNPEEQLCEKHFTETTHRNAEGRFVVKIPFKYNITELGESRTRAVQRFHSLERKFKTNPKLKESYTDFIHEYRNLNHMIKINELSSNKLNYYMPHHPVIRENSITTKIRVVFDASCITDKGNSLNSLQLIGATIQSDLYSTLLRFRQHRFVVVADIEKMYRQLLIHPDDRSFQRIFWRDSESDVLDCYELQTVTYGTASAPFLATRCLLELAEQVKTNYPTEAEIIKQDFYMDDLVTGADSIENLKTIKVNLTKILDSAKLPLRKWLSNNSLVTADTEHKKETKFFNLSDDCASKTLGLLWDARNDTLQCVNAFRQDSSAKINKRHILSCTAQLFDPLGIFSPVIVIPKIMLQHLWQLKLSWDESVPQDISYKWNKFINQLNLLTEYKIPRYISQTHCVRHELHGFADASTQAYGACVYVRSINSKNEIRVNLLTSKSRVAPLKQITLPRLELCAAVLLATLMNKVVTSLSIRFDETCYWSDSTITLCWINSDSNRWKTFVSNRVAEIQTITLSKQWHHVKSNDNPADLISRGMLPLDLNTSNLWWSGPEWLRLTKASWPETTFSYSTDDTEMKRVTLLNINQTFDLLTKFSTFLKLLRVTTYCIRFINNCKTNKINRITGSLTCQELENATNTLTKYIQSQTFTTEIALLSKGKQLPNKSLLGNLSVFLDDNGILRVGGRLKHSQFAYKKKHPMLLPGTHHFSKLIAEHEHKRLLHCGPQALLYSLREKFWPTSGRNLTRNVVRKCIKCFRCNPKTITYEMGNLPADRLQASTPFTTCGVDYAGPLNIRDKKGRGYKVIKAYICIFVCFSTKAVHLELVTDLTTEAFVATFRRFAARRGKPTDIYSDNATNFVGADAELARLKDFFLTENENIQSSLSDVGVTWHFIPPRSPHFGGLWEAAVKSAKYHLKRVLGDSLVTYEELLTIIVQIEAVMNSRPLTQLNNDPNDPQPLTPAHFLTGKALTSLADPSYFHVPSNRLGAYQHQQNIVQGFWQRWYKEYISELQVKAKWKEGSDEPPCKIGDIVVLKDDNLPPLKWRLGRIKELHYGSDNIVRVATIQFSDASTSKRALTKICPLPRNE